MARRCVAMVSLDDGCHEALASALKSSSRLAHLIPHHHVMTTCRDWMPMLAQGSSLCSSFGVPSAPTNSRACPHWMP